MSGVSMLLSGLFKKSVHRRAACKGENSIGQRRIGINVQLLSGVSRYCQGCLCCYQVYLSLTWHVLCVLAVALRGRRRTPGVGLLAIWGGLQGSGAGAEQVQHEILGHHHYRIDDDWHFSALSLFDLSVTKLIRNIRFQSLRKSSQCLFYAFCGFPRPLFCNKKCPFLGS